MSPRRSQSSQIRNVVVQMFTGVPSIEFQGKTFTNGNLGLFIGLESEKSRKHNINDQAMRAWSGMIARDESKHPSWKAEFMAVILNSPNMACDYLAPSMYTNYSRYSYEHSEGDTVETLDAPGAWTLQLAASDDMEFFNLLKHIITTSVLRDSWVPEGIHLPIHDLFHFYMNDKYKQLLYQY